jgi:aerobic C4-dicarboxylate transport protein
MSWPVSFSRCASTRSSASLTRCFSVLVLSVDWFIGMARALGNLIGNCVATVVVAAWEKEINLPLAEHVLDSDVIVEARAA